MNDTPTEPSPDRHSVARWLLAVFVLLLVAGIATAIAVALSRMEAARKAQYAVLPDGTRVELLGTSVGWATFTTDKPWMARARNYLPAPLRRWLPAEFTDAFGISSNSLTIWLRVIPAGTSPPPLMAAAEDEAGFSYVCSPGPYRNFGGRLIMPLITGAYPRRQNDFLLRLLDYRSASVASFRVLNPDRGSFPMWQPLPLPQTQSNGPMALTLRSLTASNGPMPMSLWALTASNGPTTAQITAEWKLRSSVQAWSGGRIRSVTFWDSTSNRSDYMPVYTPGATNWVNFPLSPRESVWKVHALVERPTAEDFAATEKAVLTNVQVPIKDIPGSPPLRASNAIGNLTIDVIQHGRGTLSNGVNFLEKFYVAVMDRDPEPEDQLQYTVRDDHGRELSAVDASGRPLAPYYAGWGIGLVGHCQLEFAPASDAKFLSLEFHLDRPLVFNFLVNPKNVQAAKP